MMLQLLWQLLSRDAWAVDPWLIYFTDISMPWDIPCKVEEVGAQLLSRADC